MTAYDKLIFMLAGALIYEGLTQVVVNIVRSWRDRSRTYGDSHE